MRERERKYERREEVKRGKFEKFDEGEEMKEKERREALFVPSLSAM